MSKSNNIDATVWLTLDGKDYQLNQFSINFSQAIDHKGEPQTMVRGGQMLMMIGNIVPDNIYKWAMENILKDGSVEFRTNSTNSLLKIKFVGAYCIGFNRSVDSQGGGLSTSLVISPQMICVNGKDIDNQWVK